MNSSVSDVAVFTVSIVCEIILIPYYEVREVYIRTNKTAEQINKYRARMNKRDRN